MSDDEYDGPIPAADPKAGDHALFWDEMPENPEEDATFQAMEALKQESTPEEKAEQCKRTGNGKLSLGVKSKNKAYVRESRKLYTDGINEKCSDDKLNSVLFSNRAHVESLLGNWRKCVNDAAEARRLDPTNVKAHFREAKAALKLGLWAQAEAACVAGQDADGGAPEFAEMCREAQTKGAEEARAKAVAAAKEEAITGPARRVADAILAKGWRVTMPQVKLESGSTPSLEVDGSVTWPLMIMYPENMQQDAVQAFGEADTFDAHLDEMFGPDAPPLEWDARGEYTRGRMELYYLRHAGRPMSRLQLIDAMQGRWPANVGTADAKWAPKRYGETAATWRLLDTSLTLGQLLSREDYVVPGMPLLFAVSSGTEYKERFLNHGKK
ncbi:hypothetical protein FOA52_015489 [Chlamydomonas sp. UWO 241]|nr:hypothetical protein FOA52_015489 [Chlamydomonas sp. UWO 241]